MSDRIYTLLSEEIQKTQLRTQMFTIPANGSVTLTIPSNYRGVIFTIPLTSTFDAWGVYGIRSQGQATNWLRYAKTLISCSVISVTVASTTSDPVIKNTSAYAVNALVIGSADIFGGGN